MKPVVIEDFFPKELFERLRKAVDDAPMRYGSKSNKRTDEHGHWKWKPVHDKAENLADIAGLLQSKGDLYAGWQWLSGHNAFRVHIAEPKLIRCYANGYTYGTDGYFHQDSHVESDLTAITYICDEWQYDWAGETAVIGDDGIYYSVIPRPNRTLIIPSTLQHAARAVSRKCPNLRTTLMYKVRKTRSASFEKLSSWLFTHGALSKSHSKGSLHDHLMRVFALLEPTSLATGSPIQTNTTSMPTLALAGGLHSIYGTNAYKDALFSATPDNRAMVADAFGKDAEELAHWFSLLDRPKCLEDAAGHMLDNGDPQLDWYALKMRYADHLKLPVAATRNLCLIESANLEDQESLGKWQNLKRLWAVDEVNSLRGKTL